MNKLYKKPANDLKLPQEAKVCYTKIYTSKDCQRYEVRNVDS